MILIIGGAGQGKLDYVLQKTGYGPAQVARHPGGGPDTARLCRAGGLAGAGRGGAAGGNPDVILICDEVGCGVVPVEPAQRARREAVGRLCCRLAERAERVERIFCGLPMVLKGEGPWN